MTNTDPKNRQTLYQKSRNLILYGGIGCITTAIDVAIFLVLGHFGIQKLIANTISYQSAMVASFLLNRQINFKVKDRFWWRFFTFFLINLVGYFASLGMIIVFISWIGLQQFIGKLLATIIAGIIQYIFIKQITFRRSKKGNKISKQSE